MTFVMFAEGSLYSRGWLGMPFPEEISHQINLSNISGIKTTFTESNV